MFYTRPAGAKEHELKTGEIFPIIIGVDKWGEATAIHYPQFLFNWGWFVSADRIDQEIEDLPKAPGIYLCKVVADFYEEYEAPIFNCIEHKLVTLSVEPAREAKGEGLIKKSEMVCATCINLEKSSCHLEPIKRLIRNPKEHWCSCGTWVFITEDGRRWRKNRASWGDE